MRAAAVQLTSTADRDRNLATADRLTRAAAAAGAELVVLPEKWAVLGHPRGDRRRRRAVRRPRAALGRARPRASSASTSSRARSPSASTAPTAARTPPCTSAPTAPRWPSTARSTCSTSRSAARTYRESENEAPGEELVVSETAGGVELGLSICYDLRFPELYRILAVRGARVLVVPAAFTLATTREHWEVLLRARAIEDQAFVVAANQVGEHATGYRSGGRSMIVDPWGVVLAQAPDTRDLRARRARPRAPGGDPPHAAVAGQPAPGGLPLAERGARLVAATKPTVDKRRIILDAAVRVFARQGFHTCRVSDIADEAGVAYGLVYHYFGSKDEVLDTLFLERWGLLLEAIAEIDRRDVPARDKLHAVASFIVDSYRHDPELMKVIIVEVTRAANSFGAAHLDTISDAYRQIQGIVEKAQASGEFRTTVTAQFAAMAFYGAIEQVLTGWIFGLLEQGEDSYERAKDHVVETVCRGLEAYTPAP